MASPLASTAFFKGYADVAPVQKATAQGRLDDELSDFVLDESTPLAEAVAVLSASNNVPPGGHALPEHIELLVRLRETDPARFEAFRRGQGSAHLLAVIGYAWSRTERNHPEKPLGLLRAAERRVPRSFTAAFIRSLAESDIKMSEGDRWCEIHRDTHRVVDGWRGRIDMRKPAIDAAMEYMDLFGDYCR